MSLDIEERVNLEKGIKSTDSEIQKERGNRDSELAKRASGNPDGSDNSNFTVSNANPRTGNTATQIGKSQMRKPNLQSVVE